MPLELLLTFRCFDGSLKKGCMKRVINEFVLIESSETFFKTFVKIHLPAVVSADAPHPHRVNRLRVEHGKILRVYQFQRAFVQIHEQVFPLKKIFNISFPSRFGSDRIHSIDTNIAPSPNHVQKIVSSQGQVHDAFVDGLAASLGRQIFLRDFSPPEGTHGESDRFVPALGVRSCGIASSSGKKKKKDEADSKKNWTNSDDKISIKRLT